MTAVTMDVADLVKQMNENLEAIHTTIAGLSTKEHDAKLDELEQKRDTLLGDLKSEYETEKEELAAKRKQEEEDIAEARRKEDEEREARRKKEDEELQARNESQDVERRGKFDEETKRVEEEADDGMDGVEAEVQKLLAEGEAKLKELEEKRKDINRLLDEKMSTPLPTVVPRKRARDKAAEAAAPADAPADAPAKPATEAAADAPSDTPADLPEEAPAEENVAAKADPPAEAPEDATVEVKAVNGDDAKPEHAPPAEAKADEAKTDAAENKENSKSEVSSSPSIDPDEHGSNTAKANDEPAAPASAEAEEAEEGAGEDASASPPAEGDAPVAEAEKEKEAEEEAQSIEVPAEDAEASAAADVEEAVEEEASLEAKMAPAAEDVEGKVVARSIEESPEAVPEIAAEPQNDTAEEIPDYYNTTSPNFTTNDTSPVPNDDFELSPVAEDATNETEQSVSKEDVVEEELPPADAPPPEAEAPATPSAEVNDAEAADEAATGPESSNSVDAPEPVAQVEDISKAAESAEVLERVAEITEGSETASVEAPEPMTEATPDSEITKAVEPAAEIAALAEAAEESRPAADVMEGAVTAAAAASQADVSQGPDAADNAEDPSAPAGEETRSDEPVAAEPAATAGKPDADSNVLATEAPTTDESDTVAESSSEEVDVKEPGSPEAVAAEELAAEDSRGKDIPIDDESIQVRALDDGTSDDVLESDKNLPVAEEEPPVVTSAPVEDTAAEPITFENAPQDEASEEVAEDDNKPAANDVAVAKATTPPADDSVIPEPARLESTEAEQEESVEAEEQEIGTEVLAESIPEASPEVPTRPSQDDAATTEKATESVGDSTLDVHATADESDRVVAAESTQEVSEEPTDLPAPQIASPPEEIVEEATLDPSAVEEPVRFVAIDDDATDEESAETTDKSLADIAASAVTTSEMAAPSNSNVESHSNAATATDADETVPSAAIQEDFADEPTTEVSTPLSDPVNTESKEESESQGDTPTPQAASLDRREGDIPHAETDAEDSKEQDRSLDAVQQIVADTPMDQKSPLEAPQEPKELPIESLGDTVTETDASLLPEARQDNDLEGQTSIVAETEATLETFALTEVAEAGPVQHDVEEDEAVVVPGNHITAAELQDDENEASASEKTLDDAGSPEPESNPFEDPDPVEAASHGVASESPLTSHGLEDEPTASELRSSNDDEDDDASLDAGVKPDTVDSQLTLVNGTDTSAAAKSIEEPPFSPQSESGSSAPDDESFLGTRDGGGLVDEANLAFEKRQDTAEASLSPGAVEEQLPNADEVLDKEFESDGRDIPGVLAPAGVTEESEVAIPAKQEPATPEAAMEDGHEVAPEGIVFAANTSLSPHDLDDEDRDKEHVDWTSSSADIPLLADNQSRSVERSRPSTPSEYGDEGVQYAHEGPSHLDVSAASIEQDSFPSSPLIESPYDLDDLVEDIATKRPLSPLPEDEDEDEGETAPIADDATTLINDARAFDGPPIQTFRDHMDEPESPAQQKVEESSFNVTGQAHGESTAATFEPLQESFAAANGIDATSHSTRHDGFDFNVEATRDTAHAEAERDEVALSGLGLKDSTQVPSPGQNEWDNDSERVLSREDDSSRMSSHEKDTTGTHREHSPQLEEPSRIQNAEIELDRSFLRPNTFDPWERRSPSPELTPGGLGQPSSEEGGASLEHNNGPDMTVTTRSWTPEESPPPPASPFRTWAAEPKPLSSPKVSDTPSQRWAKIGGYGDDFNNQGRWSGLPSARQYPAPTSAPAPEPTPASSHIGHYRRSEYSYESDSDEASDYGSQADQKNAGNRNSTDSQQEQFSGFIKEQTIRVVDQEDPDSPMTAVLTPRAFQPTPKLVPQSLSRDPVPSPLKLRHETSFEIPVPPKSPRRANPFARTASRPQTPIQAPAEEEFDPSMFMPRDVTNIPWHARNDSVPISLRSQSTLSSAPSSPVHSALHTDKHEPVIRDSWPRRPRNDSVLTDRTNGSEYDPFRHEAPKPYQDSPTTPNQRWSTHAGATKVTPVASNSPGTLFQKMRSVFENQTVPVQHSPTRAMDSASPTRSRPVSGVWVPVRGSRQFAGPPAWEAAYGDNQSRRAGFPNEAGDEIDERSTLLRAGDGGLEAN